MRIKQTREEFGVNWAQLYERVRKKAAEALQDRSAAPGIGVVDLENISTWSDDEFRLCLKTRGHKLYGPTIDFICSVFADLDKSLRSPIEKRHRYAAYVWGQTLAKLSEADPDQSRTAIAITADLFACMQDESFEQIARGYLRGAPPRDFLLLST
jgi:hypothetical protein